MARAHPDLILGIKVRNQIEVVKDAGLEPLRLAIQAARMAGDIPVMVHVTNPPVPFDAILALLRPGDIVSHFLHGRGHGLLDEGHHLLGSLHRGGGRGGQGPPDHALQVPEPGDAARRGGQGGHGDA